MYRMSPLIDEGFQIDLNRSETLKNIPNDNSLNLQVFETTNGNTQYGNEKTNMIVLI